MRVRRIQHKIAAWAAMLAILFAAFAPSMAHALSALKGQQSGLIVICTSVGAKTVSMPLDHSMPAGGEHQASAEHCPFCLSHAQALGAPPAVVVPLYLALAASAPPVLTLRAPASRLVRILAQPRAPPLSA